MKGKREIYSIYITRPEGVSVAKLTAYIKEAVESWGGQRSSDDPLFWPWGAKREHPPVRVHRQYVRKEDQ